MNVVIFCNIRLKYGKTCTGMEIKHLSPIELTEDERREPINIALTDSKVQILVHNGKT